MTDSTATPNELDPNSEANWVHRPPPKRDWRRAWGAIRELVADSERTDQVFVLLDALGGPSDEAGFQAFASDLRGQRQLRERADLLATLSNHEQLRTLPEGSLGRAYLAFMEESGLNAADLIEAEEAGTVAQADLDPDRRWLADRGRDSHDLWHVLTGYGRDEAGEVALLAFTYAQYPNPGIAIILLAAIVIGPKTWKFHFERYLWQAYRRGRAADLDFAPYEQWLALPLEEARERAGIVPPEKAHPTFGIVEGGREAGSGLAFGLRP
jgi:ubiquinone biosynthesis protein COQ4